LSKPKLTKSCRAEEEEEEADNGQHILFVVEFTRFAFLWDVVEYIEVIPNGLSWMTCLIYFVAEA